MSEAVAIIGVFLSIVIIMYLTRKQFPMGLNMLLASLLVGISSGMSGFKIGSITVDSLTSPQSINLVLVVFFIGVMGELLKETGSLDKMLNSLNILIKDNRILIATLPSLIGMLPVPGGAILSAPMVEEVGGKLNLSPSRMSGINMVFRHIWYLIFPLFPAIILALEMSGVPLRTFLLLNIPTTVITIVVSFFWLFRGVTNYKDSSGSPVDFKTLVNFTQSIIPLLVAVILAIVFEVYIPLALATGVVLAFFNYLTDSSQPVMGEIKKRVYYLKGGIKWNMIFAVVGILLYQDFIENSGVVDTISAGLVEIGIPLAVLLFLVPLLAGFFTGHNLAAFGIAYPIFGPMLPEGNAFFGFFALLYVTSMVGYLISPVHLCLVLTREHFQAEFKKIYHELLVPVITMLVAGVLVTVIWSI